MRARRLLWITTFTWFLFNVGCGMSLKRSSVIACNPLVLWTCER